MKKILLFGDSVMKGITYNAQRGRYALAGRHLCLPQDAQLENCAHMGASLPDVQQQIDRRLPQREEDTVAVLSFGGNDSGHDWKQVAAAPDAEHLCVTEPEVFRAGYRGCVEQLAARTSRLFITDLAPIDAA